MRRSTTPARAGRRLAGDAIPCDTGRRGTKQGLTEFLFRGRGVSHTLLLAFSVGMNIAIVVVNLLLGLARSG